MNEIKKLLDKLIEFAQNYKDGELTKKQYLKKTKSYGRKLNKMVKNNVYSQPDQFSIQMLNRMTAISIKSILSQTKIYEDESN